MVVFAGYPARLRDLVSEDFQKGSLATQRLRFTFSPNCAVLIKTFQTAFHYTYLRCSLFFISLLCILNCDVAKMLLN